MGLCFLDRELRYRRINAVLAAMNGLPASDHIGRTPEEVLPAALAGALTPILRRVRDTGEPVLGFELRAVSEADPGVLRDFLISYIPVRDWDGAVQGLNAVVQEVTALKRAERESRGRADRLELAFDVARMGWWDWDIQADRATASADLYALFGMARADFEGTLAEFLSTIHPDDLPLVQQAIAATAERGVPYDLEARVIRADGAIRWAAGKARLQRDGNGKPRALVGVSMDVTDRREAEERREAHIAAEQAARAESERVGKMKDEFLATLSHELRTPLNAILGWSAILQRNADDDVSRRKAVTVIHRNARQQAQLIDDLLDMNRILSGKLRLTPRWTTLGRAVLAAVETVRPTADVKGVALDVALGAGAALVHGDPDRLQQIVWNLLTNAIKFTPRGGSVRVALERASGGFTLSVTDTGEGITPDFLPHVFERFRQADASAAREHGGLGLGLAIVRQLAELHGGTVQVTSPGRGQGSTLTVLLPTSGSLPSNDGAAASRAPQDDERTPPPSPAPPEGGPAAALSGVHVLVVDDQLDTRDLIERLLSERGAAVTTATSAGEALARIEAATPDVLVADIAMPAVDGYELIRRLRVRAHGAVPAVALTAFARDEDRARALAAGYDEHLAKPVEAAALLSAVARLSRLRPSRRPPPS